MMLTRHRVQAVTPDRMADLAQKAVGPSPLRDMLRPSRERRSPRETTTGTRDILPLQGLARAARQRKLFRAWEADLDLVAMVMKMTSTLPRWKLEEREAGQGSPENHMLLEQFFHLPDGRHSFQTILRLTLGRMRLLGDCHWLMRYPDGGDGKGGDGKGGSVQKTQRARLHQRIAESIGPQLVEAIEEVTPGDRGLIARAVADVVTASASAPIGFEWLEGDVQYNAPEDTYVQTIGFGSTKKYDAIEVVEFRVLSPTGKPLNTMQLTEKWSDASVQVFGLNRSAARTGGMTDMLLVVNGISAHDRKLLEAKMLSRADPRRQDDYWVPMVMRAEGVEDGVDVHSVELSKRARDAMWEAFDEGLKVRKSGAMQVPLGMVGEYKQINRANMDFQQRELVSDVFSIGSDICEATTEQVIVERLGIEDWVLALEEPDLRNEEFAHRQDTVDQETGVLSLFDRMVARHDPYYVEQLAARLADVSELSPDEITERLKVPMMKVGKEWVWLDDLIDVEEEVEEPVTAPAPAATFEGPPGETPGTPGDEGAASTDGTPAQSAEVTRTLATPEAMLATLDDWQRGATERWRAVGIAYDDEGAAEALKVLPSAVWRAIDVMLHRATTPAGISDAFMRPRRLLRETDAIIKRVELPQSQLASLHATLADVFMAREEDGYAAAQAEIAGEGPEFETKPEEE